MNNVSFCPDGGYGMEKCSKCGTEYGRASNKYCPTCGEANPNYENSLKQRLSVAFAIPGFYRGGKA